MQGARYVSLGLVLLCVWQGVGCAAKPAAADLRPIDDEPRQLGSLSPRQQSELKRTMASVQPDEQAGALPAPRLRWEDVVRAAELATAEVEMAVIRIRRSPDRIVLQIKSLDDLRGELIVERCDGPEVYTAQARLGAFPSPSHELRSEKLLDQFHHFMRLLGNKRHMSDYAR